MFKNKKVILTLLILLFLISTPFLFLEPFFTGEKIVQASAFQIGSISVHWYGIFIGIALAFGFWLTGKRIAKTLDIESFDITIFWAIIGGAFGARLFFVLQNINYFHLVPDDILKISAGGLSIHGALFGGFLAAYFALGRHLKTFLRLADAAIPALLIGMILGRFGNFFNYELFGYPTEVAWKMFVPFEYRPHQFNQFEFFHPTFLYESILNTALLGFLLLKEKSYRLGELTLKFFAGISITRFIVEFFRISDKLFLGLTLAQVVSIAIIIIAFVLLKKTKGRK